MKRIGLSAIAMCALFAVFSCVNSPKPAKDANEAAQPASQGDSAAKKRAQELVTGKSDDSAKAAAAKDSASTDGKDKAAVAQVDTVGASDIPAEPTPEEVKFLESYLASLKYMVYYDEGAGIAPQMAKTAIAQANRYLIEKMGVQPIDFETVEKKKADERAAYQAESGNSVDYIQFIAQKLNADVYVEIAFGVQNESNSDKYYSTATGSMKIYNASTGDLLGSIAMNSPKTMWTTQDGATTNAITASVWMAMPKMADQSKMLLKTAWRDGIRYEMVIQNTPDSKQVSQLKRQLQKKVRRIQQDSFSAQETRWSVYTFKRADTIEDTVYDAADMAGMRDMYLVYQRGKSFVFNSGL